MEITLDEDFVQRTLTDEYDCARDEIGERGVARAFESSQRRHDERIAGAPDVATLACRAGCTWCCHFSVDVRAVEVFRILDLMEHEFSVDDRARIHQEIRTNSATLRGLDPIERMRRNVKCPFLAEGRCTIYAARPQTCRNYHATDVTGCRLSYEDPNNLEIDPDFAPFVYQAGGAHVEGFSKALRELGFDDRVYELNAAFDAALSDPTTRDRFEAKQAPFLKLRGEAVPPEFEEVDEVTRSEPSP